MKEANPFYENTIYLNEVKPDNKKKKNHEIYGISIVPDQKQKNTKIDFTGISNFLNHISEPDKVKLFEIDYNSNLNKLPDLSMFRNIEYLHLAGRKIEEYSQLKNFKTLKNLFIVNYKFTSLSDFKSHNINSFRAIRGKLETFDISVENVFLQGCSKLKFFNKIEIKTLVLESCNELDLNSIAEIKGLKRLEIIGRNKPTNLDFINNCNDLDDLVVTGIPKSKLDYTFLANKSSLKKCFIGMLNEKNLQEISGDNKSLTITNGEKCFKDGKSIDIHINYFNEN